MTRDQLIAALDGMDDGQEDCEPCVRPIPGLTAGDVRFLVWLLRDTTLSDAERQLVENLSNHKS